MRVFTAPYAEILTIHISAQPKVSLISEDDARWIEVLSINHLANLVGKFEMLLNVLCRQGLDHLDLIWMEIEILSQNDSGALTRNIEPPTKVPNRDLWFLGDDRSGGAHDLRSPYSSLARSQSIQIFINAPGSVKSVNNCLHRGSRWDWLPFPLRPPSLKSPFEAFSRPHVRVVQEYSLLWRKTLRSAVMSL